MSKPGSSTKSHPTKSFVLIGQNIDHQNIKSSAKISIDTADNYQAGLADLKKQIDEAISKDPQTTIQIIIYAHGEEDGKTISIAGKKLTRNELLKELKKLDITSKVIVQQFGCHSGAELLKTDKTKKSPDAESSKSTKNLNQRSLEQALPANWQFIANSGKRETWSILDQLLINNSLEDDIDSAFISKVKQIILFPNTFKVFDKDSSNNIISKKYEAPKPEELITECLKSGKPILEGYREYISGQIDQWQEQYFLTNQDLSEEAKKQIDAKTQSIKHQITNEIITRYINADFLTAAAENNSERIGFYLSHKELLERQHINLDINFDFGVASPLYVTCENGYSRVAKQLIDAGADINQANPSGATALYILAQNNHQRELENLLGSSTIDLNQESSAGISPLYIACQKGHTDIVNMLLEAGANAGQRSNGISPLYIACQKDHPTIVEALVAEIGIEWAATKNDNDFTPLQIACECGNLKVVEKLIEMNNQARAPSQEFLMDMQRILQIKTINTDVKKLLTQASKKHSPSSTCRLSAVKEIFGGAPHSTAIPSH
jgi:ankyrin repeat protein